MSFVGFGLCLLCTFPISVDKPLLRGSTGLRSIPAQMLDRNSMPPGNLLNRNAQSSGQTLALHRTWCVVAAHNGFDQLPVQTRLCDELINTGSRFFQVACEGFHSRSYLIIPSCGAF